MRRFGLVLLLAGAGLAVWGCRHTVNAVEVGEATGGDEYNWIKTDRHLSKTATVVSAHKGRADDLLKVQVEVRNRHSGDKKFYYRFEWLEADGMQVESPPPIWMLKTVQG